MDSDLDVDLAFLAAGCNNESGVFDEYRGILVFAADCSIILTHILHPHRRISLPAPGEGRIHACRWVVAEQRHGYLGVLVANQDGFVRLYRSQLKESAEEYVKASAWKLTDLWNLQAPVMTVAPIDAVHFAATTAKGEFFSLKPSADAAARETDAASFNDAPTSQMVHSFAPQKVTAMTVFTFSHHHVAVLALSDCSLRMFWTADSSLSEPSWQWRKESEGIRLTGPRNWITSLDSTVVETDSVASGPVAYILASSMDRSIRVWRLELQPALHSSKTTLAEFVQQKNAFALSTGLKVQVLADSLALGHENAVFFARFISSSESSASSLMILSGSSDHSLIIWERGFQDAWRPCGGAGFPAAAIGTEHHAVTFFGGSLWREEQRPGGEAAVWLTAASSTGAILRWKRSDTALAAAWIPEEPITGHIGRVESLAWGVINDSDGLPSGSRFFLLSTSRDQTARIFALRHRHWAEIARPQIHGYELKCAVVSAAGPTVEIVSGADEKVIRVFAATEQFYLRLLAAGTGRGVAELPALGLSNKESAVAPRDTVLPTTAFVSEEELVYASLWPETDKLYAHNREISAMAEMAGVLATASEAQRPEDAVIRLWSRQGSSDTGAAWINFLSVPLHQLTPTRLVFHQPSAPQDAPLFLLSLGRDRQLAVLEIAAAAHVEIIHRLEAAHSRIIWAAAWVPGTPSGTLEFLTASRDGTVKHWRGSDGQADQHARKKERLTAHEDLQPHEPEIQKLVLLQCLEFEAGEAPTALTCTATSSSPATVLLAIGHESGSISFYAKQQQQLEGAAWKFVRKLDSRGRAADDAMAPAAFISDLAFSPDGKMLAVASHDRSIRILSLKL